MNWAVLVMNWCAERGDWYCYAIKPGEAFYEHKPYLNVAHALSDGWEPVSFTGDPEPTTPELWIFKKPVTEAVICS